MRCGGVSLRALSAEGVKPRCATNDLATLPDRTPLDQSKTETCSHWAGPVARAHRLWNVRSSARGALRVSVGLCEAG